MTMNEYLLQLIGIVLYWKVIGKKKCIAIKIGFRCRIAIPNNCIVCTPDVGYVSSNDGSFALEAPAATDPVVPPWRQGGEPVVL
jgi:hypothetical protein